jgi:Ecdysteroid kinase-like family
MGTHSFARKEALAPRRYQMRARQRNVSQILSDDAHRPIAPGIKPLVSRTVRLVFGPVLHRLCGKNCWSSAITSPRRALLPAQRQAYEAILASSFLARRQRRLAELRQVTFIHGTAHTGNVMMPYDTARHRVMLMGWGLGDIDSAAIDLAFLMVLNWSPQRRAVLAKGLLAHYHDRLVADGVGNYSWDDLWFDYREAVIVMTLIPIGQFRRRSPAGRVWFGVQDSMAAFEDLHCAELF